MNLEFFQNLKLIKNNTGVFYQSKPLFIINTIQSKLEFYLFSIPDKTQKKLTK